MRSILTNFMKRHLTAVTYLDDVKIGEQQLADPFTHTTVNVEWTLWQWLRLLFKRKITVRVHIKADGVALNRWFAGADTCDRCCTNKIGQPHDGSSPSDPGYHHGDERLCHDCYYGIP